ncbi:hypothetical protein [Nocardia seriolae]|uniref:hypothetical protein n=1 Tax=Nocardia seriolae TaxID=37332 RepID=UPI001E6439C3|nr:hypothetical protein [Nocardia seriolae]WKY51661.1 hypothetical protein Q5P07_32845 [Nocardia seriolae]
MRISALRAAATTLRDNADALQRHSRAVGDHAFGVGRAFAIGSDEAGRNYAAQGIAIHEGFERVAACLRYWGAAATATADIFDRAAAEYTRIDRAHAAALTEAGR